MLLSSGVLSSLLSVQDSDAAGSGGSKNENSWLRRIFEECIIRETKFYLVGMYAGFH